MSAKIFKTPKYMLLTCFLSILVTKGSRVLEKKVNETQVSKTVFSHLIKALHMAKQDKPILEIFIATDLHGTSQRILSNINGIFLSSFYY